MTWQPAAVTPVDVPALACAYLRPALAGVWVSDARPTEDEAKAAGRPEYPARVVSVRRDGGPIDGDLDRAMLGVNVWGPTRKTAFDLAAEVVRLLLAWPTPGAAKTPTNVRCTMTPSIVPDGDPPHFYAVFSAAFRVS